jgi:ribosome maturation factor RimP
VGDVPPTLFLFYASALMIQQTRHPVVEALEPEVSKTLAAFGYELVLMKFGGPTQNQMLTVFMDKPGGVTSADCQYMAERLSVLLDLLDPVPGRYHLMVSSPGVNRPLTRDEDFDRFVGQGAAVTHRDAEGKRATWRGKLLGTQEGQVLLETETGLQHVALEQVETAHLVHDWEDTD